MADRKSIADRFWSRVQKSDACWLWVGWIDAKGYGAITVDRTHVLAHRMSWMLTRGPIPGGLFVLHHCDNPPCVNPNHLFLGTQADNMRDMSAKGRQAFGQRNGARTRPDRVARGERNGSAKLTPEKVLEVRAALASGETQRSLARRHGVCQSLICRVNRGKLWRHI